MSTSPNLGLTLMAANQAQKETVFNEFLIAFDALFKGSVISSSLTTPPSSPSAGDAYIVGSGSSGDWSGKDNDIAFYFNGWQFVVPPLKIKLYNQDLNKFVTYQGGGTGWTIDPTSTVSALGDLTNVSGSPTDGQVLTFDNASGKWKPKTPAFVGQLIALSDVSVTTGSAIDGQALYWDNASGKWKTKAVLSSVTPPTFMGLPDVTKTGAGTGWVLVYQGGVTPTAKFVDPTTLTTVGSLRNVGDVSYAGGLHIGDVLTWNGAAWGPANYVNTYSFIGMTDGPGSFDGHAGHLLRVNPVENALEYVAPGTALGLRLQDLANVNIAPGGGTDGWVVYWDNATTKWRAKALAWADIGGKPSFAAVATSGAYGDLSGRPSLAAVATSGAYADLSGRPTIPVNLGDLGDVSVSTGAGIDGKALAWNNTAGKWQAVSISTSLQALSDVSVSEGSGIDGYTLYWDNGSSKWKAKALATVATSGAYSDLSGRPSLATVATSGAYSDLSGKPTNGSWSLAALADVSMSPGSGTDGFVVYWDNASSKFKLKSNASSSSLTGLSDVNVSTGGAIDGYVLYWNNGAGKWQVKALATVATSGSYNDLSGRPTIPTNSSFSLQGLSDVGVSEGSGIDGYFLSWTNSAGKWQAKTIALTTMTDVSVTEGAGIDGYSLRWDNATSKWKAVRSQIANLGDTNINSPSTGQVMVFSGSKWVNKSAVDLPTYTIGSVSGAVTIDRANGETQIMTLTGNVTSLTINNWGGANTLAKLNLVIINTGAFSVSWPSAKWAGGSSPTVSSGAKTDIYTFLTYDGGTMLFGNVVGQNFS